MDSSSQEEGKKKITEVKTFLVPFVLDENGWEGTIKRDLPRTFPYHPYFQSDLGKHSLGRILRAIVLLLPDVSYCQGMNYVVAVLLLCALNNGNGNLDEWNPSSLDLIENYFETNDEYCDEIIEIEKKVFWIMIGLIKHRELKGIWSPGIKALKLRTVQFYKLLDNEGELVFNCYGVNDQGFLRWFRWNFVYKPLRFTLKRLPFDLRILYSRIFAFLRLIPLLGNILEKFYLVVQGDVPKVKNESFLKRLKTRYKNAFILTFDAYGSHKYQWHKTNDEIKFLINSLDPKPSKVLNTRDYFSKRPPIGCALRVFK